MMSGGNGPKNKTPGGLGPTGGLSILVFGGPCEWAPVWVSAAPVAKPIPKIKRGWSDGTTGSHGRNGTRWATGVLCVEVSGLLHREAPGECVRAYFSVSVRFND